MSVPKREEDHLLDFVVLSPSSRHPWRRRATPRWCSGTLYYPAAMRKRILVPAATFGALLVVALTLLAFGAGPEGTLLAARNTARFSSLVFSLALLAWAAGRAAAPALTWAFVSAHLVHYGAVFAQIFVNAEARAHLLATRGMVFSAAGLALALTIGFTTSARSRAGTSLHRAAASIAALSFLMALVVGAIRGHRIDVALAVFLVASIAVAAHRAFIAHREMRRRCSAAN